MIVAFYSPNAGMGKTTAAEAAIDAIHKRAEICSFAQPIKQAVEAIFNRDIKKKDMPINVNLLPFTPREAMITIGEAMKELDPEIWIKLMEAKINFNRYNRIVTVIDDLRFSNEYDMLYGRDAYLIKIIRPEVEVKMTDTEGLLECNYFHAKIINDGSLEEFKERVVETVERLIVK